MRKQLSLLAVSAIFGAGLAMATPQDQAPAPAPAPEGGQAARHQPDPNRQVKMMTKRLNLTQDQQNQILPILSDRQQQFESIRNDSSLSPKDRHSKMQSLREDSESKIKAVLTDDQKQKYDKMQQQMRARAQQRHAQSQSGQGSGQTN